MFAIRLKKLQYELKKQNIEALLITSSYNIAYITNVFAFSNEEREARILVTKKNIYLFTDARYTEMVKKIALFVTLFEISSKNSFIKLLKQTLNKEKVKDLYFEEENITYKETTDIEEELENTELIPTNDIVEKLREIKDEIEIEKIKKACNLTDLAFEFILKFLKPGVSELEIKNRLENFIRSKSGNLSFESIVAFGVNSTIPHHLSSNYELRTNNPILLDFGAKVDNYTSDMTRTVFLGRPSSRFEKIYKETLRAQEIAINYLKNYEEKDFKAKNVQKLANDSLKSSGFSPIPHAVGHGVGLHVHEEPVISPFSENRLKSGMVITIEPGVYVPNFGGVRIEDTILLKPGGIEILTKSSKKLIVI